MKVKLMALLAGFCLVVGLPLAAMAGPTPGGADADSDGVENAFDNCSSKANAAQKDADHDGCGDQCDGDFDQNGVAGISDYGTLALAFGSSIGQPAYKAVVDSDCNGVIGLADYGAFAQEFSNPPSGPSGITNAGRSATACP